MNVLPGSKTVDTYFAPSVRADEKVLFDEIEIVNHHPVMTGLLHSISGMLAVLNEHRMIVALNNSLLETLGIDNPEKVLGLRTGEALQCVHAHDEPSGCGTTKYCSTCGAAIAIVTGIGQNTPAERTCSLTANCMNKTVDITLLVNATPITIENRKFILLFLKDITRQQQRAALERTFFHDINNMLAMLIGSCELLQRKNDDLQLIENIHHTSMRLHKEIEIQRSLMASQADNYQPLKHTTSSKNILGEQKSFFSTHPAAKNKKISYQDDCPKISFNTDPFLLSRILSNMIINALEASEDNQTVKIRVEQTEKHLDFCVWNKKEIPPEIALRIFQYNFSTKKQSGRGFGTYSMKLFGEQILGGTIGFTTSKKKGTEFRLSLPV